MVGYAAFHLIREIAKTPPGRAYRITPEKAQDVLPSDAQLERESRVYDSQRAWLVDQFDPRQFIVVQLDGGGYDVHRKARQR